MESKIKFNAIYSVKIEDEAPFDLPRVKEYLKIDHDYDNELIDELICAAKLNIENFTNISLTTKRIVAHLNNSLGNIYLPLGLATDLVSVTNLDGVDFEKTKLVNGLLISPCEDDLLVSYNVTVDVIPADLKTFWMQQVAYLYEHRGDEELGDISPIIRNSLRSIRKNNY
jgi:hypothetical protein